MDFDAHHACTGRGLIKDGTPDLAETPELWRQVWTGNAESLLSAWIAERPGSRPEAWYEFTPGLPEQHDDESELDFLERIGAIGDDERAAIVAKAVELIRYNRGRKPDDPKSMFIPDTNGHIAYSIEHDLLKDDELPHVF